MNRVGIGYDVHALVEGRPCILGGVTLAHDKGLEGHSDADVLIHAIADAILGALGEGDIGKHFPNSDARWKNVSSLVFLEKIQEMLQTQKMVLINVDATIIAEAPKVLPHTEAMKEKLARALAIEPRQINLKATTNEKMGFLGRGEGIAALAIASVMPR
ncbi:MAG: 2-C-methyl-D-erythritol 2,4-cyclodiphosphate synthase [Verrucomicrobiae bacterium]|nr:2-C-methyl-D-erythritol 2,4-cyclodiphosphate synthase [Verrucomicrobiae bacterium]